jgi:hypothetical protein
MRMSVRGTAPVAGVTRSGRVRREALFPSTSGLLEGDRKVHLVIFPRLCLGFPPDPVSEKIAEDVPITGKDVFRGIEAAKSRVGFDLGLASVIVGCSCFRIVQDAVGFGDLLELRFRSLVSGMAIGMVLGRQLSEGAADVVGVGIAGHSELGVVVGVCHGLSGFEAFELEPKNPVFVFRIQKLCRAGESEVAGQNPPLDFPEKRRPARGGPLGPDDDSPAFEREVDLGLQDARKSDLEQEEVTFFQEVKDEIEQWLGHKD